MRILFVTVGFVYSRWRSTVTDGRCRQEHLTRNFSHAHCTSNCVHTHCMAQDEPRLKKCLSARFIPSSCHPWCYVFERSLVVPCFSLSCFSPSSTSSLPHSTCSLPGTPSSMSTTPRETPAAPAPNEEYCPVAIYHPPTGCDPTSLTTSATQRLLQWSSTMNLATQIRKVFVLVRCGTRRWDYRKSAIFTNVHSGARRTSEPETKLITLMKKVCCQLSPFFAHTSTVRPVYELSSRWF